MLRKCSHKLILVNFSYFIHWLISSSSVVQFVCKPIMSLSARNKSVSSAYIVHCSFELEW